MTVECGYGSGTSVATPEVSVGGASIRRRVARSTSITSAWQPPDTANSHGDRA
jgi:hypothetical protein